MCPRDHWKFPPVIRSEAETLDSLGRDLAILVRTTSGSTEHVVRANARLKHDVLPVTGYFRYILEISQPFTTKRYVGSGSTELYTTYLIAK